uniref:Uncharacterized protein n=1 Tax=Aegilops tauschii subsp. strangulata TaxID=200361 RepID=A0A453AYM8_AEGTS
LMLSPLIDFVCRKERLCCLNKDGKYNSIHKPTWITHICEEVVGHLPYHPSTRCC